MSKFQNLLPVLIFISACCPALPPVEEGVSMQLAEYRHRSICDIEYNLHFNIPLCRDSAVTGNAVIFFNNGSAALPQLDFKAQEGAVSDITVNGEQIPWKHEKEHIVFDKNSIPRGDVTIDIDFTSPDQSLNRREDLLYTLLVPDRARTLFPCFDQPNMKGKYTLELEIPEKWEAVANSSVETMSCKDGRKLIKFRQSHPLSTYLFSFVAGVFEKETTSHNGREISMYHRETDNAKRAQIPEIFKEVFESIEWIEEYTAIPYPFEKYDFIVLPGFQYGGMEHTGATLYNDSRIFLNSGVVLKEKIGRFQLIAHETAHMWFGDLVTMEWFNEVWTKEVFANYFSAQMTYWKFPEVDLGMNFVDYAIGAYSEDRTPGTVPVMQKLDNLKNAGLVYGNIIYNKSPIVMEMLATRLGPEKFQAGIRKYLAKYAYGNATWQKLIDIFALSSSYDLKKWSKIWVEEKGMPEIKCTVENPSGGKSKWEQPIAYQQVGGNIIPNIDAKSYGYFVFDKPDAISQILIDSVSVWGSVKKASTLVNLNENYLHGNYPADEYGRFLKNYLSAENEPLIFLQAVKYLSTVNLYETVPGFDDVLWRLSAKKENEECRRGAFSALTAGAGNAAALYEAFIHPERFEPFELSEQDLTSLSLELSVRMPEQSKSILELQRSRISNPDRIAKFDYISRSVVADGAALDSLFYFLLEPQNRQIEPWTAAALRYLNHPLRAERSRKYILPALEELERVQTTGDIFFPKNWVSALLSGHIEEETDEIIERFFSEHPHYSPMLTSKIMQTRLPKKNK